MKHDFAVISVKTSNKDGKKYLGKNGTQAWRVSTKIGEEWYANMIWDEDMLPKKGQSYEIELSENDGFKNWDYKLLTKKEQILEQTAPQVTKEPNYVDDIIEGNLPPKDDYAEKQSRGASWNNAVAVWCSQNDHHPAQTNFGVMMAEISELAEKITKYQSKFVNND